MGSKPFSSRTPESFHVAPVLLHSESVEARREGDDRNASARSLSDMLTFLPGQYCHSSMELFLGAEFCEKAPYPVAMRWRYGYYAIVFPILASC